MAHFNDSHTVLALIALSKAIGMYLFFIARWRHNFREIAFKNFEKSKNRRKSTT